MSSFGAFYDTRNLLLEVTGYTRPLSYEEWKAKPDGLKAAFLFVQFYKEITLAWDKADSLDFGDDSEGVSTVLQYLEKQVSTIQYFHKDDHTKKALAEFRRQNPDGYTVVEKRMIDEDPTRFSGGYIYRVAYNCLYCIAGHDRKRDKDKMNNETSSIVVHNGEELDVLDSFIDHNSSVESVVAGKAFETEFWSVIEDTGASAEKVMRYLLSQDLEDLKAHSTRSKRYKNDPLREVEVSLDTVQDILNQLREKFLDLPSDSCCGEYIANMLSEAFA